MRIHLKSLRSENGDQSRESVSQRIVVTKEENKLDRAVGSLCNLDRDRPISKMPFANDPSDQVSSRGVTRFAMRMLDTF